LIAGFVFPKRICIEACLETWNRDAGLAVAAVGWLLAVGYEALILDNQEMVPWFLGAIALCGLGLLLN
jgi:uncharacterized membrane protein (UPF0136 family)